MFFNFNVETPILLEVPIR